MSDCVQVKYGTEEYEESFALRDKLLREPFGFEFSPEDLSDEKISFHLACRRDDAVVACLYLKPLSATQVRMRQLAVRRDWQGKGLGRALVQYAEGFARDRGYEEIVLHARDTAAGFYEKTGYHQDGERFIEVGIPHMPMCKIL